MSIKRYIANKDTTITNAYYENLASRATDANMGASDSLEIFSIYGQATSASLEKSRILIQFPVSDIVLDRNSSKLPNSGSVKFFLRMFNVKHPFSLPRDYSTTISVISKSWDEGYGLDMEGYSDYGWVTSSAVIKGNGSTWKYREKDTIWENQGGDIFSQANYNLNYYFKNGDEDLELEITDIVEKWVDNTLNNNGLMIKLSGSFEDGTLNTSFYTKKFSARGSEFFYKRPVIEARWEADNLDDRNKFYRTSNNVSPVDNRMNIYFYNKVNGSLKNLYGNILPEIKFYTNSNLTGEITASYKNITNPSEGIYRANIELNTTSSIVYDKWYNSSSLATVFSSSFNVLDRENYDFNENEEYVINISNNKLKYSTNEIARFKIFSRKKDWSPTIYTKANNTIENNIIPDLYYKIFRLNDNYTVIDYSTGSLSFTKTCYNYNGNYFDLDMSLLEPGYSYGIKLARWNSVNLEEMKQVFKFKVD